MEAIAEEAKVQKTEYVDGVYEGRGDGYNDYIDVEVIIEGGVIKEIKVVYCEDTPFIWDLAVEQLTKKMISEQTLEVDTISQATYSSRGFIDAVKDALKEAIK